VQAGTSRRQGSADSLHECHADGDDAAHRLRTPPLLLGQHPRGTADDHRPAGAQLSS
jgi:hypothetical protein